MSYSPSLSNQVKWYKNHLTSDDYNSFFLSFSTSLENETPDINVVLHLFRNNLFSSSNICSRRKEGYNHSWSPRTRRASLGRRHHHLWRRRRLGRIWRRTCCCRRKEVSSCHLGETKEKVHHIRHPR